MNVAMEAAPVRVHLQTPEPAHAPEFLAAVSASRPLHRPWVSPPATQAAFRAHVARCREDNFRSLLIRRNDDDAFGGPRNLSAIQRGNLQSAYLGFYAFVPYAGLGYMTEGLTLVLRLAFGNLSLHRVEANVQPANTASLALVERVGFQRRPPFSSVAPQTPILRYRGEKPSAGSRRARRGPGTQYWRAGRSLQPDAATGFQRQAGGRG